MSVDVGKCHFFYVCGVIKIIMTAYLYYTVGI